MQLDRTTIVDALVLDSVKANPVENPFDFILVQNQINDMDDADLLKEYLNSEDFAYTWIGLDPKLVTGVGEGTVFESWEIKCRLYNSGNGTDVQIIPVICENYDQRATVKGFDFFGKPVEELQFSTEKNIVLIQMELDSKGVTYEVCNSFDEFCE